MTALNSELLFNMFEHAATNILGNVELLNELDGKTGDGDHGTTMLRICHCIEHFLEKRDGNWREEIDNLGWDVMSQDGGSAGMLVGNLFMGIGEGLTREQLSAEETAQAFQNGVERVIHFSGAHQGDKTMLDALIPAIQTMQEDVDKGVALEEMFEHAAQAARQGAEATKQMMPMRGRAKNMGERALGHIDPGAVSMAILFESFDEAIHLVH
ncbi:dihydroxyacetone kinase subunit DhaL [Vibrio breoganii]|uniref:Dihydroxyacetone kinase subunit L n=1 Tax=Vibrio breoganii TaxID=553239 RepID=A0AAJ3VQB3_9VIBR|nr:dihydroxyacetone kinase subunit DhaL [Vibrio breoganii]NMO73580.1 dihydroxyacetone kinase subunit L [Vibrio breoganii]NMR70718.1 dihydroxyacetone kinase subunit L [Vibrio breoganii]OED93001.1 dihydroxyacetone kinase subunit L [Vibrio breoganii ZF-55]OED96887.1 dihydroxyacetone kinase subunit L [Vibrio breoganii ZF-29]OEF84754.1 dihydroxyacetone kinase subunit L [Vibrio breoganii 1C10]